MYYYILEVRNELVSFSSHELSVWLSRIPFFNLVLRVLLFSNMAAKLQNNDQSLESAIQIQLTVIRKPVALSSG